MITETTPRIIADTIPGSVQKTISVYTLEAVNRAFKDPEFVKEYKEWEKTRKKTQ